MTNQKIEQAVEEIVSTVETVEFLHGVPVNLPSQYKADLRGVARKALQAQRDAGYQQCLLEIKHEQRKLLDGFGHPKDCAMCLTPPTK